MRPALLLTVRARVRKGALSLVSASRSPESFSQRAQFASSLVRSLATRAAAPLLPGWLLRIREHGVSALLGPLAPDASRFDSSLRGLTVTSVAPGVVRATLPVDEALSNSYGTLHGGATATIVDVVGTLAALSVDPSRPGVSVNMTQAFLRAAPTGKVLFLEGRCVKSGARLTFTEVELRIDSHAGPLVATGTHTKAL